MLTFSPLLTVHCSFIRQVTPALPLFHSVLLKASSYTQTNYQANYRSLPKFVPDGPTVSSINRAIIDKVFLYRRGSDFRFNTKLCFFLSSREVQQEGFLSLYSRPFQSCCVHHVSVSRTSVFVYCILTDQKKDFMDPFTSHSSIYILQQ